MACWFQSWRKIKISVLESPRKRRSHLFSAGVTGCALNSILKVLRDDNLGMESLHLTQEIEAETLLAQFRIRLEIKDDSLLGDLLDLRVTDVLEILVVYGFLDGDALVGVEDQHSEEQIDGFRRSMLESVLQTRSFTRLEALNVTASILLRKPGEVILVWCAQDVENDVQLIAVAARVELVILGVLVIGRQGEAGGTGEQWATVLGAGHDAVQHAQALGKDAAHRPYINLSGVILFEKDEFGGSVPAGHDMAGHGALQTLGVRDDNDSAVSVLLAWGICQITGTKKDGSSDSAGKTEIANLDCTILIDETIGWLQITVINTGAMKVSRTDADVIHESLDMQFCEEHGSAEQLFEIGIADLENDVEFVETIEILGNDNIVQFDQEEVGHSAENGHLTEDTLAIDQIVKNAVNSLDGDHLAASCVAGLADLSVGTMADELAHLIVLRDFPIRMRSWHLHCCERGRLALSITRCWVCCCCCL